MVTADLVAFLRARLDEDEQTARAAGGETWEAWANDIIVRDPEAIGGARNVLEVGYDGVPFRDGVMLHVVRYDPARVLAEIAVKRCILDECALVAGAPDGALLDGYGVVLARDVLRLLALPYMGCVGYRGEWRP